MRKLAIIVALFVLFATNASVAPAANRVVHVFVIVPVTYVSPITPEQAWISTVTWFGQPTDEACLSPTCTIEGYFRSQLGKVFDYDVTTVPGSIGTSGDACGQGGADGYFYGGPGGGYSLDDNRTFMVVIGAGGWAGHNPMRTGNQKGSARGLIGDWGIQNMWGVPLSCVPSWVAGQFMDRGFAHEFEGMMGAFKNATYDYFCCERPYEADHKRNVLTYSRDWLRDP